MPAAIALRLLLILLNCAAGAQAEPASAPTTDEVRQWLDAATARSAAGEQREAAALARRALNAAEMLDEPTLMATALAVAGHVELQHGDRAQTETWLRRAAALATAHARPDLRARASNDLGVLLSQNGQPGAAVGQFAASRDAARAAGDPLGALRAEVNRARALYDSGQAHAARAAAMDALPDLDALPAGPERAILAIATARALAAGSPPAAPRERARALLEDAAALAGSDARTQSFALGYASELADQAGDASAAMRLAQQAIHHAQRAAAPDSLYRWQWQVARLQARAGNARALASYREALATLDSVRNDLAASTRALDAGDGFRHRAGPLYLELVDLLLREAAATTLAATREDRLREARDTMEQLKSAELEDYFQDDCVAGLKAKTVGIDALASGTAAIYPVVLPDRLALLVSTRDTIRLHESPVAAAELAREVGALRARLEKRSTYQYLPHAQQLYRWVVEPLEADLSVAAVDTLVFVPDGILRTIPLSALHDGTRHLVERYAVGTVPGLSLTDPRAFSGATPVALLSGLTESVDGFPALPAVAGELSRVSAVYPGRELRDAGFTPRSFASALGEAEYSVVHVASHGQFGGNVDDTFLLTHDGRIDMNDLEAEIGRTATRERPVELLTLSACQTAAGDERSALGLAGVAVKAGARSALATLWSVNDRASGELVASFYEAMSTQQGSKAAALRQAQLRLLAEPRYRHPAYWSPFLLIGNWL